MSQRPRRGRRRQRGQAAVETAIVMPLFVFLVLGIIQLSLMHQARSITKYAAFMAARAGVMNSAEPNAMETAAWNVLQPLVKQGNGGQQHVQVVICAPTQNMAQGAIRAGQQNLSFDDPRAPGEDFAAKKLAVQVTFYYPLFIPFADRIIHAISRGEEAARGALFTDVVRMGVGDEAGAPPRVGSQTDQGRLTALESAGAPFVVPIRANYALRLQSDVPLQRLGPPGRCIQL